MAMGTLGEHRYQFFMMNEITLESHSGTELVSARIIVLLGQKITPSIGRSYLPRKGLEPSRLAALVPETSVYTNFTTWAGVEPI